MQFIIAFTHVLLSTGMLLMTFHVPAVCHADTGAAFHSLSTHTIYLSVVHSLVDFSVNELILIL